MTTAGTTYDSRHSHWRHIYSRICTKHDVRARPERETKRLFEEIQVRSATVMCKIYKYGFKLSERRVTYSCTRVPSARTSYELYPESTLS